DARGAAAPDALRRWTEELTGKLLASADQRQLLAGIELSGALKVASMRKKLVAKAVARDLPEGHRRAAVVALVRIDPRGHVDVLGRLLEDGAEPFGLREQAANSLGEVNQPAARAELLKSLPNAPAPLQIVIAANLVRSPEGAEKLLEAVAAGKASARLLQERAVQIRLAHRGVPNLEARLALLTKGLPPADQRLNEFMQKRKTGFFSAKTDASVGGKVFEKNCAICHQLGGKGTKIGPQLDGIGSRGLDRLLEDLIDPNRNVDQAFRATTLNLTNGQTITGLVLREEGQVVILADNQGKEVRVNKKSIEERLVSQLSPMPANLVDQIAEADFYHLMAFLLGQRAK
ncbi:MAG TPA: HEAT repeat domain-containing protein, partial [Gemmataceae bacterium]|nr:HEAT repeat domain-containing protein [Gemmataceae bacterium]